MADIRMKQKSPVAIKTLDRAAIAGDHLRVRSAKLKDEAITNQNRDSGHDAKPEGYASGRAENMARDAAYTAGSAVSDIAGDRRRKASDALKTRENTIDIRTKQRMVMESWRRRKGHIEEDAPAFAKDAVGEVRKTGNNESANAPKIQSFKGVRGKSQHHPNDPMHKQITQKRAKVRTIRISGYRAGKRAEQAAKESRRSARLTYKAVRRIIESVKAMKAALAAGGSIAMIIILVFIFFGAAFYCFGDESSSNYTPVSAEVEAYTPLISKYANEYGIGEYVDLIKAVMMQESGGSGSDPMQAAEGSFNKKYPHVPNGIKDPEYSIECGVQELKAALESAKVKNPLDMDRIRLALQGYNYGNGYISWAIKRDGGYTVENAAVFSDEQAKKHGWKGYGDKQYVAHVLRYYPYGNYNIGIGNTRITQVAAAQIGNHGGKKFWLWYGFNGRVAWCACYVSWCADQCGYIKAGIVPKFSSVNEGVSWFKSKNQWQKRSYKPSPGDIIFFDWKGNGTCDHVGIVEKCDGRRVYTIEGNTSDQCARRSYPVGYYEIYGYGVPKY